MRLREQEESGLVCEMSDALGRHGPTNSLEVALVCAKAPAKRRPRWRSARCRASKVGVLGSAFGRRHRFLSSLKATLSDAALDLMMTKFLESLNRNTEEAATFAGSRTSWRLVAEINEHKPPCELGGELVEETPLAMGLGGQLSRLHIE